MSLIGASLPTAEAVNVIYIKKMSFENTSSVKEQTTWYIVNYEIRLWGRRNKLWLTNVVSIGPKSIHLFYSFICVYENLTYSNLSCFECGWICPHFLTHVEEVRERKNTEIRKTEILKTYNLYGRSTSIHIYGKNNMCTVFAVTNFSLI